MKPRLLKESSTPFLLDIFYIVAIFWTITLSRTVWCDDSEDLLRQGQDRHLGMRRRPPRDAPPRYMFELYRRLRAGNSEGEMYRSILPEKGPHSLSIKFSAEGLVSDGGVSGAELHLRTRRRRENQQNSTYTTEAELSQVDLKPAFRTFVRVGDEEINLPLHSSRYPGWKRFDVIELLGRHLNNKLELDLRFESLDGYPISPRKLIRISRTPFLLLHINQSDPDFQQDFLPEETDRPRRKRFVEISAHPNDVHSFDLHHSNEVEAGAATEEPPQSGLNNEGRYHRRNENSKRRRLMRKKMENEVLNLYDEEDEDDALILDYEEDDLSEDEAQTFRFKIDNTGTIPYPKQTDRKQNKKSRKRSRKNRKEKKRKSKDDGFLLPKIWKSLSHEVDMGKLQKTSNECRLHTYSVNLRDVGYGRRIISPKSYDANYCAGTCQFPLKKSVSPTNHATILSILSWREEDVPTACCVPKKMDSLTVLYFDTDGSVVLKTYSQMSVQSCGCR